ncbi:hypothetical protein DIPPA_19553 [Diplonema papillatum]|nr:hypothetical protein DIPPA_19553 [Diplonema papillatum]
MKLPLPSDAPPTLTLAPSQSAMQLIRAGTMRRLASKRSSFRTRSISVTLPTVGGTPRTRTS